MSRGPFPGFAIEKKERLMFMHNHFLLLCHSGTTAEVHTLCVQTCLNKAKVKERTTLCCIFIGLWRKHASLHTQLTI